MAYQIVDARYAKGKKIIQCESDGSGYKTSEMLLAERIGGKWVHRSRGYTVSSRQAIRFEEEIRKYAGVSSMVEPFLAKE